MKPAPQTSQRPGNWFLETSAVVDLVLGKGYHELYSRLISSGTCVSNQYVRMELKRGVIQYLTYIHNKVANSESWADAMNSVTRLVQAQRQWHRMGTILESLDSFWRAIHGASAGSEPLGEFLQRKARQHLALLVYSLWDAFEDLVEVSSNPMRCYEDIEEPVTKGNLIYNAPSTCTGSKIPCAIKSYVAQQKTSFRKVLNGLDRMKDPRCSKAIGSLKRHLRKCELGSYEFSNRDSSAARSCWDCGDVIIGVSAPPECTILTSNTRDFQPIASALNKQIQPQT